MERRSSLSTVTLSPASIYHLPTYHRLCLTVMEFQSQKQTRTTQSSLQQIPIRTLQTSQRPTMTSWQSSCAAATPRSLLTSNLRHLLAPANKTTNSKQSDRATNGRGVTGLDRTRTQIRTPVLPVRTKTAIESGLNIKM